MPLALTVMGLAQYTQIHLWVATAEQALQQVSFAGQATIRVGCATCGICLFQVCVLPMYQRLQHPST
jgi:hypothetical protein